MYKDEKATIKIDRSLYDELKSYADTIHLSVTKLLQFCLKDFLSQDGENKIKNSFVKNGIKTVRISLSEKEISELEKYKKEHGFRSLRRECEFRLLNSLRDKKEYYSNIDIENFIRVRTDLNTIGRNLNVIAKRVQAQDNTKLEIKNLEKFLEYIQSSINNTIAVLAKSIDKNQERF